MAEPLSNPLPEAPAGKALLEKVVVVHFPDDLPTAQPVTDTLGAVLSDADAKVNAGEPTPKLDRAQDEVMTVISPDGRPPVRALRLAEWKWFIAAGIVLSVGGLLWAAVSGVAWPTLALAGTFVVLLLGAAVPTWGAGLLRGGEEKRAREAALVASVRSDPPR